ncbi:MAG: hypothetical protein P9X24_01720 [Candidatus Hatepunaea meridiana]|nr:hypothetical protein [Candidatus Hatepunaea meridiana]
MLKISKLFLIAILITFTLSGCTTIPKEVVELSYTMGHDLEALRQSYRTLITTHFDLLRKQREDFIVNDYIPA